MVAITLEINTMVRMIFAGLIAWSALAAAPAFAADNCYAAGQQEAAKRGAQLASAESIGGGKCKVVLVVPAANGQHPKREEVIVNG